jgi:ribosomal protein S18 acetylase RimI-like enzyme
VPPEFDDTPRLSDVAGVRRLAAKTGVFNDAEIRIAGELVEQTLSGEDEDYRFLFLRGVAGEVPAYACYGEIPMTDGRYDLYWIVASPELQGTGVASRLLAEVEGRIRAQGGAHLYAETSGTDIYLPARKFYLKNGFVQAAVLKDFYLDGDDKAIFRKML